MHGIEMVGLVHRQALASGKTGADAIGAGKLLAPDRTQVQAGFSQAGVTLQIADEVDGHALVIGQQDRIAQPRHLFV